MKNSHVVWRVFHKSIYDYLFKKSSNSIVINLTNKLDNYKRWK